MPGGGPGVQASGERAHVREPLCDQRASRTGRRCLVGSRTVEDDLALDRELREIVRQGFQAQVPRARDRAPVAKACSIRANVPNARWVACCETCGELVGRDSRHGESAREAPALPEAPEQVERERG